MIRWERTEYVDIKTGEILSWKEIKERGIHLRVIREEVKIKKNENNEFRKCIKYGEIVSEQPKLW